MTLPSTLLAEKLDEAEFENRRLRAALREWVEQAEKIRVVDESYEQTKNRVERSREALADEGERDG